MIREAGPAGLHPAAGRLRNGEGKAQKNTMTALTRAAAAACLMLAMTGCTTRPPARIRP
jgi:hypothetical protein